MRLDGQGQGQDKGRAQASLLGEPFPSRSQECAINWPNPLSKEVIWAVVVTVTGRRGSSFLSLPFFLFSTSFFLLPNFNCHSCPVTTCVELGKMVRGSFKMRSARAKKKYGAVQE